MPLRFQNGQWGLVLQELYSGDLVTVLKAMTSELILAMQKGDCLVNEIALTLILAIKVRFVEVRKLPCEICHSNKGD